MLLRTRSHFSCCLASKRSSTSLTGICFTEILTFWLTGDWVDSNIITMSAFSSIALKMLLSLTFLKSRSIFVSTFSCPFAGEASSKSAATTINRKKQVLTFMINFKLFDLDKKDKQRPIQKNIVFCIICSGFIFK